MEELWEVGHPEIRPQHTARHEKLAAVFTYISAGTSCSPLTQLKMLMRIYLCCINIACAWCHARLLAHPSL